MNPEQVKKIESDAEYWTKMAPKGYKLIGFTERISALFEVTDQLLNHTPDRRRRRTAAVNS